MNENLKVQKGNFPSVYLGTKGAGGFNAQASQGSCPSPGDVKGPIMLRGKKNCKIKLSCGNHDVVWWVDILKINWDW